MEILGVPSLPPADHPIDVELRLGTAPDVAKEISSDPKQLAYVSPHILESGEPALRMWRISPSDFLHIEYYDGTEFWLDEKHKSVWATWREDSSLENTASYLFGPILGVLLRLRGITCLHASAVVIREHAVVLVGAEGAGKSTTAAAFARAGHGVISDDIVALVEQEGIFRVVPAYPHLALWPEAVDVLFGSPNALPRITQEWDKRRLSLGRNGTSFERRTLPLGAVYLLGSRILGATPEVQDTRPQAAHLSLLSNSYGSNILTSELRASEFALIGSLVAKIPIRQLVRSDDLSQLSDLCRLICDDFDTLVQ